MTPESPQSNDRGMKLIFLYGEPGAGKLTIGRELAELTGMALFHNHLVVDAVGAVFPFGTDAFVKLRERFWLDIFAEACAASQSLIFTFAPEQTVASDFPQRVRTLVQSMGGEVLFIRLIAPSDEQERRIVAPGRAAFGKLRSLDLFRQLKPQFEAAMSMMPAPILTIDTGALQPRAAAQAIAKAIAK